MFAKRLKKETDSLKRNESRTGFFLMLPQNARENFNYVVGPEMVFPNEELTQPVLVPLLGPDGVGK